MSNCHYPSSKRFESIEAAKRGYKCEGSEIPVISGVILPSDTVGKYDLFEISFLLSAKYDNPFDPDDICVDGVFTCPDGKVAVVPAFFMEPMRSTTGKTLLVYSPETFEMIGCGGWKIRFAARMEGEYSFYIKARDSKGNTCESEAYSFTATEKGNKGFVQVSNTDPGRFENSGDGSPFWGTGANIPWVRAQFTKNPEHLSYEYFISKAADTTNCTRVWICHWAWLEWMPEEGHPSTYAYCGMTYFNQCVCSAFDSIVNMCEEKGLRIIACLDDNDEHYLHGSYGNWKFNPYNKENGGPVDGVGNYFKTKEVLPYYKKRLRYIVARWGYSSAILSLNLWNDYSCPSKDVVDYLDELCQYTHSITANWRDMLFGSNFKMDANKVLDYTTQSPTTFDGTKPNVTNECWASSNIDWFRDSLETIVWSELAAGFTVTMNWDHDRIDELGCWDLFQRALSFTADIPFQGGKNIPSELPILSADIPEGINPAKVITVRSYGDIMSWGQKATENNFYLDSRSSSIFLEGYTSNLYSGHTARWKNPPTFHIDTPHGGRLILEFDEIGSGEQKVDVVINGQNVRKVTWVGGRRYLKYDERFINCDLEKGRNSVFVDNTGEDWARIHGAYFVINAESAADMVTAHRLSNKDYSFIYLQNQTYYELYRTVLKEEPADIKNICFDVGDLEIGQYVLSVYDPTDDSYLCREEIDVTEGKWTVNIPCLKKHLAIKLIKKEFSAEGYSTFKPLQLRSK